MIIQGYRKTHISSHDWIIRCKSCIILNSKFFYKYIYKRFYRLNKLTYIYYIVYVVNNLNIQFEIKKETQTTFCFNFFKNYIFLKLIDVWIPFNGSFIYILNFLFITHAVIEPRTQDMNPKKPLLIIWR